MPDADSLDAVNKFAGADIVDFDRFVIFGDDEEPVIFQVGRQVVEMVLHADHARGGQILGQLIGGNIRLATANIREFDLPDKFQRRRVRGKHLRARRKPHHHDQCGKPDEIPANETHSFPPEFQNFFGGPSSSSDVSAPANDGL